MRKLGLVFGFCLTQFLCIGQTAQWKIGDTLPNFAYDGQFARDYQLSDLKGSMC